MKKISKSDSAVLRQFKKWARHLLEVNPGYVKNPKRLQGYIQGPNWDEPDIEYAHYRSTISMYGNELLGVFERMRAAKCGKGLDEYIGLLGLAGVEMEE